MAHYEIQEEFLIEDPETLKVIADPLRLDIMKLLVKPKTVKEIAAELDVPPTNLYYHINQLEKHNIIRVVETNVVSGIIEKRYLITARSYQMGEQLLAQRESAEENMDSLLDVIFNTTRAELQRSQQAGYLDPNQEKPKRKAVVSRLMICLTPEQIDYFHNKLQALIQEMDELSQENEEDAEYPAYGVTIAFYPIEPS